MNKYYLFLCIIWCNISCTNTSEKPLLLPENAKELIAGTSGKTWKLARRYNNGTRMNMAGCFLSYRITYKPNMNFSDNNGESQNCGSTLKGNWKIEQDKKRKSYIRITSDQLPEIMNINKNYKYFRILQLSEDSLKIRFRHKQFSSESTFVDLLVPENAEIKGRDFHW